MRDITNNARSESAIGVLHLFEMDMYELDGTFKEILYLTDHDIYVNHLGNEYVPLSITFDRLVEDVSLTASSISIQVDNVNDELSNMALSYEWRNNRITIERVVYIPPTEIINGDEYKYGVGDNLDEYPRFKLDDIPKKDTYPLFTGIVDAFGASEASIDITATTQFASWGRTFPTRTFNQNEFTTIVDTIKKVVYWGTKDQNVATPSSGGEGLGSGGLL